MKRQGVKNPLRKRILREIADDWKKYFLICLFLVLMTGFVSGMYVANDSMLRSASDGKQRYRLEDGHFELANEADDTLLENISSGTGPDGESVPVRLYRNYYRNESEDNNNDGVSDGTIRVYAKNEDINLACLMDGRFPENQNEIAVDRMHADNAGISVGDRITVGDSVFEVTGLIAYVNYATLHEKNTDLMFDAIKFDVAMVTDDGFDRLNKSLHYTYAWKYEQTPEDDIQEKRFSDDFKKILFKYTALNGIQIDDYIPGYANQAVNFATDDMGSDKAMGGVILYILVIIIAFIFAVTITNTINKEASAIGTLMASGYTKRELVIHYISVPVIVTLVASILGNISGYTVFKNVVVSMYYNSYSLPKYETFWNMEAFVRTTLIPFVLMFIINLLVIIHMMAYRPLQFLRHELKKKKKEKTVRLPGWKFMSRFRMRIILQNIPDYVILFAGVSFVMIILAMAIGMPSTLDYYKSNAKDMMLADYQYVLKTNTDAAGNIITTSNTDAEKYSMCSLQRKSEGITEEISVYGVADGSRYIKADGLNELKDNGVYISKSYSDKYGVKKGDVITLDKKYEDTEYEFVVRDITDISQTLSVFMPIDKYNDTFDVSSGKFTGYMSDTQITDISEEYIATVITEYDITKMCDQLDHSMGSYMSYYQVLCVLIAIVLVYLLTKIIIEKNENSISMIKILGYSDREIAGLYMYANTIVMIVSDAIGVFVGAAVMKQLWRAVMLSYSGWYDFYMKPSDLLKMFVFVFVGYFVVMFFDFKRIRRIPMDEALKNAE